MTPHEAIELYNLKRVRVIELQTELAKLRTEEKRVKALGAELEGKLKRARAELVDASDALPKAVHCDLAGILGKDAPPAPTAEAPQ